jgi:hypothetical protein
VANPTSTDWVGVYQSFGGPFVDWFYAGSCTYSAGASEGASGSCAYTMPTTQGSRSYVFVLYAVGSWRQLAKSNPVGVSGTESLSASPASVAQGGSVTVSWNVTSPTSTDWVGVYQSGFSGDRYLDWFYAGSCTKTAGASEGASGSCAYTMTFSLIDGPYDFILYHAGTYQEVAVSNTVTVT